MCKDNLNYEVLDTEIKLKPDAIIAKIGAKYLSLVGKMGPLRTKQIGAALPWKS